MNRSTFICILSLTISLCACQTPAPLQPTFTPSVIHHTETPSPTIPPYIPPLETMLPTSTQSIPAATATPTSALTPTISLTFTQFAPFDAVTTAANVYLRVGPAYLFPALGVLPEGGTLKVLGKAPGGEWFRVRTLEKKEGWVFALLLRAGINLQEAPIVQPQGIQLIKGRVRDGNGTPIKGIAFNVVQGTESAAKTNTIVTDANGEFFSFMPADAAGLWSVSFAGIGCDSNVWTDSTCTYSKGEYKGVLDPSSVDVLLPHTDVLEFLWK
jgi:hypothetical protein